MCGSELEFTPHDTSNEDARIAQSGDRSYARRREKRSAARTERPLQPPFHQLGMPPYPAEQRFEKSADVSGVLRADLEKLLVRDFVIEVDQPVAIARQPHEKRTLRLVKHLRPSERERDLLVLCRSRPIPLARMWRPRSSSASTTRFRRLCSGT